jgi:hypothetical protein
MIFARTKRICILLLFISHAMQPAWGQEIIGLGGWLKDYSKTYGETYSWQVEYQEALSEHFAYSISYINEGHLWNNHRDGQALQLWLRTKLFDPRLSLAVGAGPFLYYNTTRAEVGTTWSNNHGWGALLSLGATWYTSDNWFLHVRTNWNQTTTSFSTASTLFGIGYQFAPPSSTGQAEHATTPREESLKNEITLFYGQTIINSFGSELADAVSLEYRRSLFPSVDWTISFLYEGEDQVIRRNGLITQIWGMRSFFSHRLSLGIGGGAYFVFNRHEYEHTTSTQGKDIAGVVSITSSYRFFPHWGMRFTWDRIVTNYDRDADVILCGIGYHF